jgi:cellulose synthase operon protein C
MFIAIRPILVVVLLVSVVVVPARETWSDEVDDQFALAAGHYDRQDWKLAVEGFQAFIDKYPKDRRVSESVFFLGEALRQLGKYGEARRQFQIYSSREPKGRRAPAALFGAGEAAYLAGDLVVAKADLTQFLEKYPGNPLNAYALPYLGDIALSTGDLVAATTSFQNGLKQFTEGRPHDDCRLGLARVLERQNKADEAERLYLAVANKPGSHVADAAQFRLGALQCASGRYDEALKSLAAFEERLATSPWQPNARLYAGMALLKSRRPDEAIKRFDVVLATPMIDDETAQQAARGKIEALLQTKDYASVDRETAQFEKRFPKSSLAGDVRRMLARSLVERKEYVKAAALLESLIAASPPGRLDQPSLENRYLLARSYEGLGRYEDGLAALLPVVDNAKGPLKSDAQSTQGALLLVLKKYSEATVALEELLADKPSGDVEARAIGQLAICYARTKQLDKAKKSYAELIKKYPKHALLAPTTEHLAEAAYDANDTGWAKELSERLAALGASAEYEFKGKLNLGWSQYKAGNLAEAAATFDELLKKNPPAAIAAEAAFVRGRILQEMGQNQDALAMYDATIERYPQSKHHGDALLAAARLRVKLKQQAQAVSLYERLAKEHPRYPKLDAALYEWAWAMQESGKPDEAVQLFERLRKECSQSRFAADAACRLAQRALDAKDYPQAERLVDEVLNRKIEGDDRTKQSDAKVREYAAFLRGQIAVAKADWPKVREAFEKMVQEYPNSGRRPLAEYWVAEAQYRQGDYAAASKRLEQLTKDLKGKREPWMAIIPLRRAQSLAQQNRWNDAYEIASGIEKDYPNFEQQYEADYLLGRCLANRAEFDAARLMYGRAIRSAVGAKTETAARARWMIGETYFHQKNYEAAIREYKAVEILYDYPTWQAGALLQAGKCYERLGDAKEAVKLYQKIVKTYPNTSFAKDAAKELARPEGATPPK